MTFKHKDEFFEKRDAGLDQAALKELFLITYEAFRGNHGLAATAAKIAYNTVYNWREADEEFRVKMDEVKATTREVRLDNAEEAVDDLVEQRDGATARWLLDRLGGDRGYGQVVKQRHGGMDGPRIEVDVQGDYPPVPKTVEEWEVQQEATIAARKARKAASDESAA